MPLQPLVPNHIWHAQQALMFGPISVTSRMTVVKLSDGNLWIHSPIRPTTALIEALSEIGPVSFVVAPNKSHHLFFLPFLQSFPQAQGFVAPGLIEKRPDLKGLTVLGSVGANVWSPDLLSVVVEGLPILNETIWFHQTSGTLIITDLLFCFGKQNTGLALIISKLLGVYDRLGMSRTMKLLVKDKNELARTAQSLLALDVKRIVLAHDQVIEEDAKQKLKQAFDWLF